MRDTFPWKDGTALPMCGPITRELLLTEMEGVVELRKFQDGLWFFQAVPLVPGAGHPRLYYHPGPMHVLEVMMANRGWGGNWIEKPGERPKYEALAMIAEFRSKPMMDQAEYIASIVGKNVRQVRKLYERFSVYPVYGGRNDAVWFNLGF